MNTQRFTASLAGAILLVSGVAFAAGSIEGTVAFSGTPPKPQKLNRKSDPVCAKKDFNDESVLLSSNGKALQNVLVRVKDAPPSAKMPTEDVMIDQKDCMYRPRVQGAVVGQKIKVRNNDPTLHNVHSYEGTKTLFNQAQPPGSAPIEKPLPKSDDLVKVKCDVHPWMAAFVVLNKSSYFAVTKEDGSFQIKDVPAGTYTIEAWHEKYGTQDQEVTLAASGTQTLDFTFKAE
ncbi:MAG TPA: carboxypeptidase regulatory-like domain-containing protein [Myxococcaceae bacterium]|nr:carboxypeptidase regulatory-like domain-containing protein [Myxococcaceae bacterium]